MDQVTTVWLIRHALTDGADGRCCGRLDLQLSLQGRQQAQELAKRLAPEWISHIYSSRLRRALETAQIVAKRHDLAVETMDELAEMNFGDLEGRRYEEIQQQYPEVFESWMTRPTETHFPNGESFGQMRARVLGALDLLLDRHRNQSIALVTHSGVIRVVLGKALSMPDSEIFRLVQGYSAVNRIKYFQHGPLVELING